LVLSKMNALENVGRERGATDFKSAFQGDVELDPEKLADEVWARMEAAAERAC
jgi:hypothetical protein